VLITDFDGVVIDGMAEYWWAASCCAKRLLPDLGPLPEAPPPLFKALRPRVLAGWEMPVLAALVGGKTLPEQDFLQNYSTALTASLALLGWHQAELTQLLDQVRQEAIASDRSAWLAKHQPYPWMQERLWRFQQEGEPWQVLTTKSAKFTEELLAAHGLHPLAVHGREAGAKPQVLARLLTSAEQPNRTRWRFLEDRRLSLEEVLATPGLEQVNCLLVSWGYLLAADKENLPARICLLDPEILALPLDDWP
jgi:phosphoglycolate phosphatase-like HAD superfamily hydrolase